jgi:hypothetical protein
MLWVFVVSNLVIAGSYLVLGFYVAPRLDIVANQGLVLLAKYGMLFFFVCCAITHFEQAAHVLSEPSANVAWMLSYHMVISHLLQAMAAPVVALVATRFFIISARPVTR